jgi:hypothetical protein
MVPVLVSTIAFGGGAILIVAYLILLSTDTGRPRGGSAAHKGIPKGG